MPERCMQMLKQIITEIENRQNITRDQLALLLETTDTGDIAFLHERARKTADAIYGKQVFIRGLIEFTNYCKNDCIYCGIRKSNRKAERYRLTEEEILSCCANGYELGFRTFVLQGGEDPYFTDDKICALIRQIKAQYPDCAVTLSIGEKEHDSYQAFFDAGADRYLLRHETADEAHYGKLHPAEMFWKHRMDCLWDLKEIGYQVGCGFMVGSPEQTVDTLYGTSAAGARLSANLATISTASAAACRRTASSMTILFCRSAKWKPRDREEKPWISNYFIGKRGAASR